MIIIIIIITIIIVRTLIVIIALTQIIMIIMIIIVLNDKNSSRGHQTLRHALHPVHEGNRALLSGDLRGTIFVLMLFMLLMCC